MKKHYFNIVTPSGYIVCDNLPTLEEAAKTKKELIELDKADNTYTPGFYKIERVFCQR